jgi:hypothetical protein
LTTKGRDYGRNGTKGMISERFTILELDNAYAMNKCDPLPDARPRISEGCMSKIMVIVDFALIVMIAFCIKCAGYSSVEVESGIPCSARFNYAISEARSVQPLSTLP